MISARPWPIGMPRWNTDIASGRFLGGKASVTMEKADGLSDASPTPTPIRARKSCAYPRVRPQYAVITLQSEMPQNTIVRRFALSISRLIGRPTTA